MCSFWKVLKEGCQFQRASQKRRKMDTIVCRKLSTVPCMEVSRMNWPSLLCYMLGLGIETQDRNSSFFLMGQTVGTFCFRPSKSHHSPWVKIVSSLGRKTYPLKNLLQVRLGIPGRYLCLTGRSLWLESIECYGVLVESSEGSEVEKDKVPGGTLVSYLYGW